MTTPQQLKHRSPARSPARGLGADFVLDNREIAVFEACRYGRYEVALAAVSADPSFFASSRDECGRSLLWHASHGGHQALVKALLDAKADVTTADAMRYTALHVACERGFSDICKMMLERSTDASELIVASDAGGRTPLYIACETGNFGLVCELLKYPVDLRAATRGGFTALMAAARANSADIVSLLLEHGADPSQTTPILGQHALSIAASLGFLGVVHVLVEHDPSLAILLQADGSSPFMHACDGGNVHVLRRLLSVSSVAGKLLEKDHYGWNALGWCARAGHVECAELLLKEAAASGLTHELLDAVSSQDASALVVAVDWRQFEFASFLIQKHGAEVNHKTDQGLTALMLACESEDPQAGEFVNVLLARSDIDTEVVDTVHGHRCYEFAIRAGHADTAIALLERVQPNPHYRTHSGDTLLSYACRQKCYSVVDYLLKHLDKFPGQIAGPCVAAAMEIQSMSLLELFLSEGASADSVIGSVPALILAVEDGNVDAIRLLVRYGASLSTTHPETGASVWTTCAVLNRKDVFRELLKVHWPLREVIVKCIEIARHAGAADVLAFLQSKDCSPSLRSVSHDSMVAEVVDDQLPEEVPSPRKMRRIA
jgi:ankyrin repeat protein